MIAAVMLKDCCSHVGCRKKERKNERMKEGRMKEGIPSFEGKTFFEERLTAP